MGISKKKLKQSYKFISKNKYWLTGAVFVIWLLFFDSNNFFHLMKNHRQIESLAKQEKFYKNKIHSDSLRINQLNTNDQTLEKFARERYFFHKPNEVVFKIHPTKK